MPMDEIRNPFQYGRELDADELVNRRDELAEIAATVRNRGKLFLVGPRRYGKTSLLRAAEQQAQAKGVVVLRFDAEKYEGLDVLARAMLTAAARSLQPTLDKLRAWVAETATRLRPQLSMDADGSVHLTLGIDAQADPLPLLSDALDGLERLAETTGREVAVFLDEVQQVVVEHGVEAERQLRATVQRHRSVSYVFAGSDTRLLSAMTGDPGRPFYRLGGRLFLREIPRDELLAFLDAGFRRHGFAVDEGGCERILDLAAEVPYNVQRLAHEAWEMLRAQEAPSLDAATAAEALRRILRKEDPAYTQLWTTLSRNQKKVVKVVVATGGVGLQSAEVSRRFAIPPSSVRTTLDQLEALHVVRREAIAGDNRYRLIDPFLAGWIDLVQQL
jgi:uncharacterized protein